METTPLTALKFATTTTEAYRLGLKLVRVVVTEYPQPDMPSELEHHLEICEAPVAGRRLNWRVLQADLLRKDDAVRALAYYLRMMPGAVRVEDHVVTAKAS